MPATKGNETTTQDRTTLERTSDRELVITRTFNGPARIVFDAWTNADLVRRWWAPRSRGVTMASCEADVRPGGKYRYVLRHDEGGEFAFSGQYSEVTPHTRLVYTQVFEPMAAHGEAIVTITFQERDAKTKLIAREVYPSKEVLDQTLASGMEGGMRETLDQLDALIASLR
jgi:uncharacterized protein YndB with AHSA1/START domain